MKWLFSVINFECLSISRKSIFVIDFRAPFFILRVLHVERRGLCFVTVSFTAVSLLSIHEKWSRRFLIYVIAALSGLQFFNGFWRRYFYVTITAVLHVQTFYSSSTEPYMIVILAVGQSFLNALKVFQNKSFFK